MGIFHPIIDTKLFIAVFAYMTFGFTFEFISYFAVAIILDYILRMATAGLTFNYQGYPHKISEKKINFLRWVSTLLVCLVLSFLLKDFLF